MHSVEKKELICENSSHREKNLEQHDTINVSQMPTVCMSNEKALHLN